MRLSAYGRSVDIDWADDADHIPRRIAATGDFYERALLADCYDRNLAGLYVDAGAHIGNHTLFFAGIMGRSVLAFEPNPATYDQLNANIDANDLWHLVSTRCAALGPRAGWGSLRDGTPNNTGAAGVAFDDKGGVAIVALDDLKLDVAVLKVDVEGQAMAVLSGAASTIERCRPLVYVESDGDGRIDAMFGDLRYIHLGWMGATPTHVWAAAA